jgi:hypothetical protein
MANAPKIKGPYILGFPASHVSLPEGNWLVVSTSLKNMSQLGLFFPIYGKVKNVPNHQPVIPMLVA